MIRTVLKTVRTNKGNTISLIDGGGDGKTILIIGVFHGDEPSGKYLIERYLKEDTAHKNRLLFIPCLNPDGLEACTRCNSKGVDLNRNFPAQNWQKSNRDKYFGGETPASEIETQFLVSVIEKYTPALILTLHEPYCVVNYDGPALKVAERISEITKYEVEESIGYPTPGSFGTYCGVERKIPVITLELAPTIESEDAEIPIVTPESLWCHYEKIMNYLGNW